MQNDAIVSTFGQLFTSGAQVNPIYLQVRSNSTATVLVSQLGSNTSQIGFTIKAPNGTTIHQRASGNNFTTGTSFVTFCLIAVCPAPTNLKLTITMSDSYGDGWNGNVLGIRQNNSIVGTFGSTFVSGYSTSPVDIVVQGNLRTQIIVNTLGSYTSEVGFVVKAPNGTIIYSRTSGSYFSSATIFSTFCPLGGCIASPNTTCYVTEIDDYGDGWEGTVLAFKQGSNILHTFTLASGY